MDLKQVIGGLRSQLQSIDGVGDEVMAQLNQLSDGVSQFDGIDPQAARDAIAANAQRSQLDEQLQTLTSEKTELNHQIDQLQTTTTDLHKQLAAVRGLNQAGVRPTYEDLLLPQVISAVDFSNDQATLPDHYWSNLKQKYPAMFYADDATGSGGAAQGGQTPEPGPTQVTVGSDRIISGVAPGDVLAGRVAIAESA